MDWPDEVCEFSEFDEITDGYTLMQLHKELEYQCNQMGYSVTDPFPVYLKDKINQIAINKSN